MAAIRMKIGTNTTRNNVVVDDAMSPKQALANEDIDFSGATVHLDGSALAPKEMNTSFKDLGTTDDSYLICVIKTSNAAVIA